jgi:ankyrin repeat protein
MTPKEKLLKKRNTNNYYQDLKKLFLSSCETDNITEIIRISNETIFKENIDKNFNEIKNEGFILACSYGKLHIIKHLLINHDFIDISTQIAQEENSLIDNITLQAGLNKSSEHGHLDVVKYLLTIPSFKKYAPSSLKHSAIYGQLEILKYLLTNSDLKDYCNIHSNNDECLIQACYHGQLETVKFLLTSSDLKEHSNITADDNWAFKYACKYGHSDIVKYLVEHGSYFHDIHDSGFDLACIHGHFDIVKYLTEQGTDINDHNCRGLMASCIHGHLEIFQYLIEKGIDVKDQDGFISTNYLKQAIHHEKPNIIEYLITENLIAMNHATKELIKDKTDIKNLFDSVALYIKLNNETQKYKKDIVKLKI